MVVHQSEARGTVAPQLLVVAKANKTESTASLAVSGDDTHQIELTTPFKRKRFNVGHFTISDIRTRYEANIGFARSGDANAMLEVADAIENCRDAEGGDRVATALRENGSISQDEYDELAALTIECQPIIGDVQAESKDNGQVQLPTAAQEWREKAAAAGNRIARLQMLVTGGMKMYEAASLADQLVDSLDYRVLYAVSDLVGKTSEAGDIETEKWNYLACLHNPECSPQVVVDDMGIMGFSPAQVADVKSFAKTFQSINSYDYTMTSRLMDKYGGEVVPTNERLGQYLLEQLRKNAPKPKPSAKVAN